MSVLFLGHLAENSGWGRMAKSLLLAMDGAGIDCAARSIALNSSVGQISGRVAELVRKPVEGCNAVIQCLLPHHYEYRSGLKNIGYCCYETIGNKSIWGEKLRLLDEIWCPSSYTATCISSMGIDRRKIKIVPIPFDISVFEKEYEPLKHPSLDGNYIFLAVGDSNNRKNLLAIVQAFNLAFTPNQPVRLLIKTSKFGVKQEQLRDGLMKDIESVKKAMKLYGSPDKYLQEIMITDDISDEDMMKVYNSADAFVSASRGESFNMCLFSAMASGLICAFSESKKEQHYDFIDDNIGFACFANESPVMNMNDSFDFLYRGNESWLEIDILNLAKTMKFIYANRDSKRINDMCQRGIERSKDYSLEKIGERIKKLL